MLSPMRASSSRVWRKRVTTPSVAGKKVSVKNAIRNGRSRDLLQVGDDGLRKLLRARRASQVLGTGLWALESRFAAPLHALGLFVVAEVIEHVLRREQGGERVGAVLSGVLGGRPVHRLEDRCILTDVGPGR